MRFKKGAFFTFTPVKVLALKYSTPDFFPIVDEIPMDIIFVMLCCNSFTKVTIYEYEGLFDPSYLKLD